MAGRDPIPGEREEFGGLRDHNRYHARVVRGQIKSVTPENGSVQVSSIEIIGTRDITVPMLWFSGSGGKSCWGRFMPSGGENIHLEYRNDGTAVIIGYDPKSAESGEGWPILYQRQAEGVPGFGSIRKLQSGEYDFKSSGDAYIHGSNTGTLLLCGGLAFIRLDKQNFKYESEAGAYLNQSAACTHRFGTVYRKLSPTSPESPINLGAHNEFLADIGNSISGVPKLHSTAFIHFGDITDPTTHAPILSTSTTPSSLQGLISLGNPSGTTEVFRFEADVAGNMNIKAQATAHMDAPRILLGALTAAEPLVLGNQLASALKNFIDTVFIANQANWGVGNMGAPVPLFPSVVVALQTWETAYTIPTTSPYHSLKSFTEKGL